MRQGRLKRSSWLKAYFPTKTTLIFFCGNPVAKPMPALRVNKSRKTPVSQSSSLFTRWSYPYDDMLLRNIRFISQGPITYGRTVRNIFPINSLPFYHLFSNELIIFLSLIDWKLFNDPFSPISFWFVMVEAVHSTQVVLKWFSSSFARITAAFHGIKYSLNGLLFSIILLQ